MGVLPRRAGKTGACRFAAGGLIVAVLAGLLALVVAAPASADEDQKVCGTPIQVGEQVDITDVSGYMAQGQQQVNKTVLRATGLPAAWQQRLCGPLQSAVEMGAKALVEETLWGFVGVELPNGLKAIIEVEQKVWERLKGEQPREIPAVGPSNVTVLAPVAWTNGVELNLRTEPARVGFIAGVPEGDVVTIMCTTRGEMISDGPNGPTDLWDRVVYNGQVGYVSDAYLFTGTNDPVAPSC